MEDATQALASIIARCPDLAHQATSALLAHQRNSPIAQQRVLAVIGDALRLHGDEFDDAERAELDSLARVAAGGKPRRGNNILIRVSDDEKARVQANADAAGQSMSDYIRQRIGL